MKIITPSLAHIESYKAALHQGWSPNNVRPEAADEDLQAISEDPVAYIESLTDLQARGAPIRLPDGSLVERLSGFIRWIWDGEFCGQVGFRWQPGKEELPDHVLGHAGYNVVPWKRGQGYATQAFSQLLMQLEFTGLEYITVTIDADNIASQKVAEKCGAVLHDEFVKPSAYENSRSFRYRIYLL